MRSYLWVKKWRRVSLGETRRVWSPGLAFALWEEPPSLLDLHVVNGGKVNYRREYTGSEGKPLETYGAIKFHILKMEWRVLSESIFWVEKDHGGVRPEQGYLGAIAGLVRADGLEHGHSRSGEWNGLFVLIPALQEEYVGPADESGVRCEKGKASRPSRRLTAARKSRTELWAMKGQIPVRRWETSRAGKKQQRKAKWLHALEPCTWQASMYTCRQNIHIKYKYIK